MQTSAIVSFIHIWEFDGWYNPKNTYPIRVNDLNLPYGLVMFLCVCCCIDRTHKIVYFSLNFWEVFWQKQVKRCLGLVVVLFFFSVSTQGRLYKLHVVNIRVGRIFSAQGVLLNLKYFYKFLFFDMNHFVCRLMNG